MSTTSWLMPNKMIDIARGRKTGTPTIEFTSRPVVRQCVTEQQIKEEGLDEKTTKAMLKAHVCYQNYKEQRAKKKIKIIDFIEIHNSETTPTTGARISRADKLKCKAMTMAGKPCPFRASCGDFCKKHQQPEEFKI
ncbi:hypothetical protein N9C10_01340 [Flavobacteriaceae bacterium]|nr:hypothetical protein [Flavobacteriaceae bacterium]